MESSEVVLLDNDQSFRGSDGTGMWCSFDDDEEGDDVQEEHLAMVPILEGELKRKLLKKAGKNVSVSSSGVLSVHSSNNIAVDNLSTEDSLLLAI